MSLKLTIVASKLLLLFYGADRSLKASIQWQIQRQENHENSKLQTRMVTSSLRGPYLISGECFMKNVNIIGQEKTNFEVIAFCKKIKHIMQSVLKFSKFNFGINI